MSATESDVRYLIFVALEAERARFATALDDLAREIQLDSDRWANFPERRRSRQATADAIAGVATALRKTKP